MTTLIASYNSEGCQNRCDAKCYDAQGPICDCICRGANHGKGLSKAMENTRLLAQAWMDAYRKDHPEVKYFEVPGVQLPLPL